MWNFDNTPLGEQACNPEYKTHESESTMPNRAIADRATLAGQIASEAAEIARERGVPVREALELARKKLSR